MGSASSRQLKVERYKWSSAEFPQEYAFVSTALHNESETSVFRISVSPNKVLCRLADYFCRDPPNPVRIHLEVTAERNNNKKGEYDFREVVAAADRTNSENHWPQHQEVQYHYYRNYPNTITSYFKVSRGYQSIAGGNLNKTNWELMHIYFVGMTVLSFHATIQCDKVRGLCVEFEGPFKGKQYMTLEKFPIDLHILQVEGAPPRGYIEEVEIESNGKGYTLFKQAKETIASSSVSSATVLINNKGSQFQGHGNGSVYDHCEFYYNVPPPPQHTL